MNDRNQVQIFSSFELAEIANGIAFQLEVPITKVSVTQGENGLLTVTVFGHSFTGNLDQVHAWAKELKASWDNGPESKDAEPDTDFEP